LVSSASTSQIAVVYLAYVPYGREPIRRFVASYEAHDAGCEHDLVVVEKGPEKIRQVHSMHLPDHGYVHALNDRLDLGTYLYVARVYPARRYVFLNTSSEILADGWLEKLNSHLSGNVGIVGATGSYGNSIRRRVPTPHIRTNAFMLERDPMLDLDWQEPIQTKEQAFAVEHGERSITAQILERGLEALVVGRDGEAFPVGSWIKSNTFWINDQENLLIADNATRKYADNPNGYHRRVLTRFAWA
jgi:hypothetical protein